MSIVESTRAFHLSGYYFSGEVAPFIKLNHSGSQAVLVGNRVYLTGQIGRDSSHVVGTTVFMVDMKSGKTRTASFEAGPYARLHMCHVWRDSLYIYGGSQCMNAEAQRGLWRYDTVLEEFCLVEARNAAPIYRERVTGGVLEETDELVLYGGMITSSLRPTNEILLFDLDTEVWSKPKVTGKPPPARVSSFGCMVDGKLFAVSGPGISYSPGRFHVLNCRVKPFSWSQVETPGSPRIFERKFSLTHVPATSMLILIGGSYLDEESSPFKVYNTKTGKWSRVYKHRTPKTTEERENMFSVVGTLHGLYFGHAAVFTSKGILILGGGDPYKRPMLMQAL